MTPETVTASISAASVSRAVRIVDAFAKALEQHECQFRPTKWGGMRLHIQEAQFEWSLRESRNKDAHKPTRDDLEKQAAYEDSRRRNPQGYSAAARKIYRTWDPVPSGRLVLTLTNVTEFGGDYSPRERKLV